MRSFSTSRGNSSLFGHKDYHHALSTGASDKEILAFLDANQNLLYSGNKRGAGGLYDEIKARIPTDPGLKVDPRIGNLEQQLQASNQQLANFQSLYNQSAKTYQTNLDSLQGAVQSYQGQISGYQNQISNLDKRLTEQAAKANQFKLMDTQYVTGNDSSGVRLRRSKAAREGLNILGASGFNRKNRSQLSIKSLNP